MRVYARTRMPDGRVKRLTLGADEPGSGGSTAEPMRDLRSRVSREFAPETRTKWWLLRALDQEDYKRHF